MNEKQEYKDGWRRMFDTSSTHSTQACEGRCTSFMRDQIRSLFAAIVGERVPDAYVGQGRPG
jgi:hypothetical protein